MTGSQERDPSEHWPLIKGVHHPGTSGLLTRGAVTGREGPKPFSRQKRKIGVWNRKPASTGGGKKAVGGKGGKGLKIFRLTESPLLGEENVLKERGPL